MRNFSWFILFVSILSSCQNDPSSKNNEKDSTFDSINNVTSNNDTFRIDSAGVSHTYYNCSILNKQIPPDSAQAQIRRDLADLIHCGIDSFDFLYVVPNLFPGFVSENHVQGNKKVKYSDFVNHLNEFRTTEAYYELHIRVQTLDSLRHTKFEPEKLYSMKPTLGKLGFTEPEWQMFSGFARTYPVPKKGKFSWGDMLDAFDKYRPQ